MNKIANVLDTEWDQETKRLVEIGITTVDLQDRTIRSSISMPIRGAIDYVSKECTELTGWTAKKLMSRGISLNDAIHRIQFKYGGINRLWVVDTASELDFLQKERSYLAKYNFNVSSFYKISNKDFTNKSLDDMLSTYSMNFIGKRHSAKDDSTNIARLFLRLISPDGYYFKDN